MSQNIYVKWHDEELQRLFDRWPRRTQWAMSESLKMAGGHIRKKIVEFIEDGGCSRPPLSLYTRARRKYEGPPLTWLAKFAGWRYTGGKNPRVRIGFYTKRERGKAEQNRRRAESFKKFFGGTPAAIAKKHEFGKRIRISPGMRMALRDAALRHGLKPLQKTTKFITIPKRPMVGPVFRRERNEIPKYIGRKFWEKMESGEGPFR